MTNKAVYLDWEERTRKAFSILGDKALPKWKKAHMVGGAYAGLELDQLQSKHRRKVYNCLSDMNQILRRYSLKEWDDYEQIQEVDIQQLIDLAKGLACPKLK